MTKGSKTSGFRVVTGGKSPGDASPSGKSRPETVRTTIAHEGARLVLNGTMEVWEITDPGAWDGKDVGELPIFVAYVTVGLARSRGLYTPDDAADAVRRALEECDELTPGRREALADLLADGDVERDAFAARSMEFWWQRWWPRLRVS
jgi:hypothetical protein